jgi:hypothetical protein
MKITEKVEALGHMEAIEIKETEMVEEEKQEKPQAKEKEKKNFKI